MRLCAVPRVGPDLIVRLFKLRSGHSSGGPHRPARRVPNITITSALNHRPGGHQKGAEQS